MVFLLFMFCAGCIYFLNLNQSGIDSGGLNWIYFLVLIQLLPFSISFALGKPSYLALILLFHALTYSYGKISYQLFIGDKIQFDSGDFLEIQQVILCTILIIISYYIFINLLKGNKIEKKLNYIDAKPVLIYSALTMLFSWLYFADYLPLELSQIAIVTVFMLQALLFCIKCPENPILEKVAQGAVFIFSYFYYAKVGSMQMLVQTGLCLLVIHYQRVDLKALIYLPIIFLTGLYIQVAKGKFRYYLYSHGEASMTEKISTSLNITYQGLLDPNSLKNMDDLEEGSPGTTEVDDEEKGLYLVKAMERMFDESLKRVLARTPDPVPFWNGRTYEALLFTFIPRFVWPDKPGRNWMNEFGMKYQYLTEGDNITSIACSFLAEGYLNYGYLGLYGVAIFFGVLVAFFESIALSLFGFPSLWGYVVFLLPLLSYQSDLAVFVLPQLYQLVILIPLRHFMSFMTR